MSSPQARLSCIILAGGMNSRMGQEKALLSLGEKTLIEVQKEALEPIFEELIVVTNGENRFQHLQVKVVKDVIPGLGPIGGLFTGLSVSSNIHNFLIACDMPFVQIRLIEYMIRQIGENDIVIPKTQRGLEALFAIYSLNCLETIQRQVESRNFRLVDILEFHKVRYITPGGVKRIDKHGFSFFNINSPEDFEEAKKIWKKR